MESIKLPTRVDQIMQGLLRLLNLKMAIKKQLQHHLKNENR